MSCSRTMNTEMNDLECVDKALKGLGFKTSRKTTKTIRGDGAETIRGDFALVCSHEDNKDKIKRDLGFNKRADGTFSLTTDTYVNRTIAGKTPDAFLLDLKVGYGEEKAKANAVKAGARMLSRQVRANGDVVLKFVAPQSLHA